MRTSLLQIFYIWWLLTLYCTDARRRTFHRIKPPSYEIVPDEPADPKQYPYVVKLTIRFPNREHPEICSGALITRSLIMTAGHCVATDEDVGIVKKVEFPPGIAQEKIEAQGVFGIYRIFPPIEDFTLNDQIDVAIVELKNPLSICEPVSHQGISILKLPIKDVNSEIWEPVSLGRQQFNNCTLLGYGKTVAGNHKLRKISNTALWHRNHRFLIPLLSVERQGRTCYGDSGGPTICNDFNGNPRLYGITSFASGQLELQTAKWRCFGEDSTYLVDVLTDVQYILPQLRQILQEHGKLQELIDDYRHCI